jgi:hypothetical protein
MRNLSVVAMLLGISAACSNQPATTVSPPTEADSKPAAGAPPRDRRLPPHGPRSRSRRGRPGHRLPASDLQMECAPESGQDQAAVLTVGRAC